jgi:glutathione S-transferase
VKLYDSLGPNPRVVRMFIAEKGVDIATQFVDVISGENRQLPYIADVNHRGQCPALELDDGSHLCEITAICEYLEEKFPTPPLIGITPEQRAETRMWTRRVDLLVCEPLASGFRFSTGYEMFKDRFHVIPEAANGLKVTAAKNLAWLDSELGSQPYLCGERFTLADILLYCFLLFGKDRGEQPLAADNKNIAAWFSRVGGRASASA